MNNSLSQFISQIELITLILVLLKWKYQYKDLLFFKIYIIAGYITDQLGHELFLHAKPKLGVINYNLYVLISTTLIILFLRQINKIKINTAILMITLYVIIWIVDNIIINSITITNSICRITSHSIIIFLSFYTIKKRIEIYNFEIKNEPTFIILIGFCLNSIFRIIYEAIYLTSIPTKELNNAISILIPMINFTLYTFFIYALICLKKPTKLISQY